MNLRGTPVLIRAVVLLAGFGLVLVPAPVHPVTAGATGVGVLLAVLAPAQVGSTAVTGGFLAAWLAATGWSGTPSVGATAAGGALLYVLHVATALAAQVPLGARVETAVARRFASRCVTPVVLAAAFGALDLALPANAGSPLIELAGLGGVLVLAGVLGVRLRRPAQVTAAQEGP